MDKNKNRSLIGSIVISDIKFWLVFMTVIYLMILMSSCTFDNPGYIPNNHHDMGVDMSDDMDISITSNDMHEADMRRERCKVFAGISCENEDMASICGVLFKCVCAEVTGCCCTSM